MSNSRSLAHPMIEPLDYSLTPEKARSVLSGNTLAVYSLLWNAALATMAEGPVIRKQKLVLTVSNPVEDPSLPPTAFLQLRNQWIEEPGWLLILPSEEKLMDLNAMPLPELLQNALDAAPTKIEADGTRSRCSDACVSFVELLCAPNTWVCEIVKVVPKPLRYDNLIEQMAANGVGRPSTFADRLQTAIENDLVADSREGLMVGHSGQDILDKLSSLPGTTVVNAKFCSDLEIKLEEIELDPLKAGSVLTEFCKRALDNSTGLADWLDELVIQGESLNEAIHRVANTLPPSDSWHEAILPFGIDPLRFVKHPEQAKTARSELDAMLAASDIPRWKALLPRARAVRRLIAITNVDTNLDTDSWVVRCNRDIVWRWWIDLGPNEVPLHVDELRAAEAEVSVLTERQGGELTLLCARLTEALA